MPGYLITLGQMGLSIAMLSVFALAGGAVLFWRRGQDRRKSALMLILAAVILANVLIVAL